MMKLRERAQNFGIPNMALNPNYRTQQQISKYLEQICFFTSNNSEPPQVLPKAKRDYLFYPDNIFLVFWNTIQMIFIFYNLTFLPYLLVFQIDTPLYNFIDDFIDLLFLIDILLNFNTTYPLENGQGFESSRLKIALRYIKSYFFFDLISTFPFRFFISDEQFN